MPRGWCSQCIRCEPCSTGIAVVLAHAYFCIGLVSSLHQKSSKRMAMFEVSFDLDHNGRFC